MLLSGVNEMLKVILKAVEKVEWKRLSLVLGVGLVAWLSLMFVLWSIGQWVGIAIGGILSHHGLKYLLQEPKT